jgi:hypothetical protein
MANIGGPKLVSGGLQIFVSKLFCAFGRETLIRDHPRERNIDLKLMVHHFDCSKTQIFRRHVATLGTQLAGGRPRRRSLPTAGAVLRKLFRD